MGTTTTTRTDTRTTRAGALHRLPVAELEALVRRRYDKATRDRTIARLRAVAATLGMRAGAGTGVEHRVGAVRLALEGPGPDARLTAEVGGKAVLDTAPADGLAFVIPGPWAALVLASYPAVLRIRGYEARARCHERRERVLARLR